MGKKKRESYPTSKIYIDKVAFDIPVQVHAFIDRHMKMFEAVKMQITTLSEVVADLSEEMKLDEKAKAELQPHHFVALDVMNGYKEWKKAQESTTTPQDTQPSEPSDEESVEGPQSES